MWLTLNFQIQKSFIIKQEISVCLEVEVGYLSAKISKKVKINLH